MTTLMFKKMKLMEVDKHQLVDVVNLTED